MTIKTYLATVILIAFSQASCANTLILNFGHTPFSSGSVIAHPGTTVVSGLDDESISREITYMGNDLSGTMQVDVHRGYSPTYSGINQVFITTNLNIDFMTVGVHYNFMGDPAAPITSFISNSVIDRVNVKIVDPIDPLICYRCGYTNGYQFNADAGLDYYLISNTGLSQSSASELRAASYGFKLYSDVTTIPVPASFWLLGSGLMILIGVVRKK